MGRRLAAVQLVGTGLASNRETAAAFAVTETTLWRWRRAHETDGVEGLTPRRPGLRGPSRLTAEKVAEIVAARAEGLSMAQIGVRVGVSLNSVSRALRGASGPADGPAAEDRPAVDGSRVDADADAVEGPAADARCGDADGQARAEE